MVQAAVGIAVASEEITIGLQDDDLESSAKNKNISWVSRWWWLW
jgi:pseudouridine-5'-phosphate glycosidase